MSKICPETGEKVIYLTCLECETKSCKNTCRKKHVEYKLYMKGTSHSELLSFLLSLRVHQRFQIDNIIQCDKINFCFFASF